MKKICTALLLTAALVLTPALANADSVYIKFESPEVKKVFRPWWRGGSKTLPTLQYDSGWPLTIELVMNRELGITVYEGGEPFFPTRGQTGFVVFSDPDDCLELNWPTENPSCDGVADELFVEFTPDIDNVGLPDQIGRADLQMKLLDGLSAGLTGFNATIGPPTGVLQDVLGTGGEEEIVDGYGKGADDDIPGLVLVAQHGQGIVFNDENHSLSYTVQQPLELVNLAGFVNSVGYGLNNRWNRTVITVQTIVPRSFIAPAAFYDTCYTGGGPKGTDNINCALWWSIDGAAPQELLPATDPDHDVHPSAAYAELLSSIEYTVSAFVVSGTGPDRVIDGNGDGIIDDVDLEMMGYDVLGSKSSVILSQLSGDECFGEYKHKNLVFADLDGNGITGVTGDCGPGSGSVSRVPR